VQQPKVEEEPKLLILGSMEFYSPGSHRDKRKRCWLQEQSQESKLKLAKKSSGFGE